MKWLFPIMVGKPTFLDKIKIAAVATNGCVESLPVAGALRLDIYEPNFTIDVFARPL
ncbi:MAG: hypothetical protein R3F47_15775 [Gammaproteobacteria bacterium]